MVLPNKAYTGITILAILLTAIAALFAANLLVTGIQLPTVQEIPEGSTGQSVETVPYPPAIPMLLSALVLLGGLLTRKLWVAWVGCFGDIEYLVFVQQRCRPRPHYPLIVAFPDCAYHHKAKNGLILKRAEF